VIAGFSYGGICSLQMATNHPEVYRNFVDISGLEDATLDLGQRQQTIDKIFGGDEAKFKAINPKDIMASKRFEGTSGWFIAGSEDSDTNPGQRTLNQIAQSAGMILSGPAPWLRIARTRSAMASSSVTSAPASPKQPKVLDG